MGTRWQVRSRLRQVVAMKLNTTTVGEAGLCMLVLAENEHGNIVRAWLITSDGALSCWSNRRLSILQTRMI